MKKILICGFPHCGTTILRSIIGHCDEVEELINETKEINSKTNKKFMLCKYPFAEKKFFEKEYDDYIKIFVIRNPIFVYSSLKKRYSDYRRIPNSHRFNKYVENLELFTYCKNNLVKSRKVFTIRYEDLFENNHENLKKILISIGINFTKHMTVFFLMMLILLLFYVWNINSRKDYRKKILKTFFKNMKIE